MALWTIGGQMLVAQQYDTDVHTQPGPEIFPPAVLSLNYQLLVQLAKRYPLAIAIPALGPTTGYSYSALLKKASFKPPPYSEPIVSVTYGGGTGNFPSGQANGGYNGFRGNIAELWVNNTFIDWTNSAERAKFHVKDTSTSIWYPVQLGADGSTPTGSKPYLYLSGGAKDFPANRASAVNAPNGTSQFTSLNVSGALLDTNLPWPPPLGTG